MQSIDEVDESWAWSPSSIHLRPPPPPPPPPFLAPFPSRLLCPTTPLYRCPLALPAHPPTQTHTMPHTTNINATSSRARLFDVLDDEKCEACRRAECL